MCSTWNARFTTTRLIFILRFSADVTSSPITPSMASPCALSMIVRRIQVELRAQLDFKSVRIWLNEEGENGYQQCEWDCAVTSVRICVCVARGRMALVSLALIGVPPHTMFITIVIPGVAGARKKMLRQS